MKIRQGFVSNSSSCSFTCDICNHNEAGSDSIGMLDYGFTYCDNGHELCLGCLLEEYDNEEPEIENFKTPEEYEIAYEKWEENPDGCPASVCPICQFIEPSQKDMAVYLKKVYNISRDKVFSEIKKYNKKRKKLYDFEYITYVCKEHDVQLTELLPKIKEKFGTYEKFQQFLSDKY